MTPPVSSNRGASAIVTNVRWDAVDAKVSKTNGAIAYGEIVRVRRPGAGVKLAGIFSQAMVATKPVTRTTTYKP